ncbi:hypothetical protein XNC1_1885 [Xenorhabdus nematophila ATCC 19061]|uniref:Uncharacterized protein n=1 Tax=Xenorhabdus nematophila (strain ATCC 19061 / DSM 3370 / CCUG 14189 / LMG 1036 / NCIMB 9965 / AN6) TaxID=406817 RepID=D3VD79_XENNA|nr:hypothetical protein XNC1_1885 [Xenorhabdus nematophila ATCC 19061]
MVLVKDLLQRQERLLVVWLVRELRER